jgi:hypothetical protein
MTQYRIIAVKTVQKHKEFLPLTLNFKKQYRITNCLLKVLLFMRKIEFGIGRQNVIILTN